MRPLPGLRAFMACLPPLFIVAATATWPHAASAGASEHGDGYHRSYCAEDAVFQAVPLQGLLAGVLESSITFSSVLKHGDFGLGGMSPLEGEVIVLDGMPYQARVDGSVRAVDLAERTAVLWVKRFRPDRRLTTSAIADFDALIAQLDAGLGTPNRVHAIRIDGRFDRLTLRSVPRQSPPYAPVTEVVQSQNVYSLEDVEGSLVGFRFPTWASGINAPGYHFHFIDAGRRRGGHVLDVAAAPLVARIDTSRAVTVVTPDDTLFDDAKLPAPAGNEGYLRALRTEERPESGP